MDSSALKSFDHWIHADTVASGMAVLSLVVTIGLFIGAIRIRRIRLGIPGVLFAALLFGQSGLGVDPKILQFLMDFALILFMYCVGLQVGPSFVSSLQTEGLRLNVLAVAVLVLGAVLTAAVGRAVGPPSVPGLYAGAFTTTPGLAAAQEVFRTTRKTSPAGAANPADQKEIGQANAVRTGLAYSITYPFGIIGPVLVILLLKRMLGIRIDDEIRDLTAADEKRRPPLETADFQVTKTQHIGKRLRELTLLREGGIVLTRILRDSAITVPTADTQIALGDIYRAIGTRDRLAELVQALGEHSDVKLADPAGALQRMDIVVTRTQVLRRTLRELNITSRTGVTIGRVHRCGVDLIPRANLRLAFADHLTVVGPEAGLKMAATEFGNAPESLNQPRLVPIFLGIFLGVVIGSIPLIVPGLGVRLRIGLAGGPLIAAIALAQLGNIGSIVWYMPASANQLFRDFGLAVFLACVGLQAGDHFLQHAAQGPGLALLALGTLVTIIPVFLVALFARLVLRMNFITLAGWIAGAMTSSPALIFSDELAQSDAPAVAYAAVAPLATLIPILCAQILALMYN